jgi:NAD(P)-dependent dehydrogenase (short-subunit alcohol dehydrogenase family)
MEMRTPASVDDLLGMHGKRALIIGGGRGMGRVSAEVLAVAGASVALVDVDREPVEAVAESIRGGGGTATALVADVCRPDEAGRVVQDAADALGDLDTLVNVVGGASWSDLASMPDEMFGHELRLNLQQVFNTAAAFARTLKERAHGGTIVSISSVSGMEAAPGHGAYGVAKAGLMALTKTMAIEWGPLGIRANCIAPGAIRTDRVPGTEKLETVLADIVPIGRRGDQLDIAKVVLFLVSDLSTYVTGQTIVADGGVMNTFPLPTRKSPGNLFG